MLYDNEMIYYVDCITPLLHTENMTCVQNVGKMCVWDKEILNGSRDVEMQPRCIRGLAKGSETVQKPRDENISLIFLKLKFK